MRTLKLGVIAALLFCACTLVHAQSEVAPDQRRPVEQTFLTYPEWFLVHSPAEYAAFVQQHPAHDFPFLGHIGQLWSSYAAVTREQLRAGYPANPGYHVMILVIGISTTVEYGLRAIYENSFGRLSWLLSTHHATDEDRYAARVAQDYVDFIRREPWYLFDFEARLSGLWRDTPAFGANPLRKWERRYALSSEYAVKALYARLIEKGTRASYTPALMTTQVVVDRLSETPLADVDASIKLMRELPDGGAVLDLPRYAAFRIAATRLAAENVSFRDIAGNDSVLLVTAWTRDALPPDPALRLLFEQPLLTMPGWRRVALVVPVSGLSGFLHLAPSRGLLVEHVHDY